MKILQKRQLSFHRIEKRIKAFLVLTLRFIKIAPFLSWKIAIFHRWRGIMIC